MLFQSNVQFQRNRLIAAGATLSLLLASRGFASNRELLSEQMGRRGSISLLAADDNDVVIKVEELPQSIRDYIAKDMPDGKITEARKDYKGNKEKKGDNFTYEVSVKQGKKEFEFRFASDGKLIKKREEAGDEPDEKK